MSKIPSLFLCLILALSFGCTSDNSDTKPDIVPTIEDEFNIRLWEHLSPDENAFSLLVETISDQECLNSIIRNNFSIFPNNLVVNLNGIEQPDDCIEGAAPAFADVSFANLTIGTYDLEVNILSIIKNEGFIEVSPESIKLELNSDDGIYIANNVLKRVPNNTYWGYIALDKMDLTSAASSFLEEIEILKDDFDFVDGDYGHFNIMENNTVDFEVDTNFPDHDKFIIKYTRDIDELREMIKSFREESEFVDKLEIKVMTFEGMEL